MRTGRPAFSPTAEQRTYVEVLYSVGHPLEEIARIIINQSTGRHISKNTLCKYFREELDTARTKFLVICASKLRSKIINDDTASLLFALKTQFGWRETNRLEVDHKNEPRIEMTEEEIDAELKRRGYPVTLPEE
jgi:hypothetical protein